jgi:hypothetical protein
MNGRQVREMVLGIFFLALGLWSLAQTPAVAGILIVMALLFFAFRDANRSRPRQPSARYPLDQADARFASRRAAPNIEPPPDDGMYTHALDAARAAGMTPENSFVLPIDIGVMAYERDGRRVIHRMLPLNSLTDYLQPFIQLRLAANAYGRLKFEIVDENDERLFVHEERHRFAQGVNFITPPSRLRVQPGDNAATWRLRVYADDSLIADHALLWEVGTSAVVRRNLLEDGEISPEIGAQVRTLLNQNRLTDISLDELLASQDDDSARAARR